MVRRIQNVLHHSSRAVDVLWCHIVGSLFVILGRLGLEVGRFPARKACSRGHPPSPQRNWTIVSACCLHDTHCMTNFVVGLRSTLKGSLYESPSGKKPANSARTTMTTTHMPNICSIFRMSSICPMKLRFFLDVLHDVASANPLEYSSGVLGELVRRRKLNDMTS